MKSDACRGAERDRPAITADHIDHNGNGRQMKSITWRDGKCRWIGNLPAKMRDFGKRQRLAGIWQYLAACPAAAGSRGETAAGRAESKVRSCPQSSCYRGVEETVL
jgi:hypothetical protein